MTVTETISMQALQTLLVMISLGAAKTLEFLVKEKPSYKMQECGNQYHATMWHWLGHGQDGYQRSL